MADSAAPLARLTTVSVIGADTFTIEVQAHITPGLAGLDLTGLPDASQPATRSRVLAAIANSDLGWPRRRISVSLTPSGVIKPGTWFDLPIAVAMLAANGTLPLAVCAEMLLIGELAEDGTLRPVPGALAAARHAAATGIGTIVVPSGNILEAQFVHGITVLTARTLRELVDLLGGDHPGWGPDSPPPPPTTPPPPSAGGRTLSPALVDLPIPATARRALAASAAGGHHLLLCGSRTSGAQILADQLATLLPPLDAAAEMEVATIRSIAGRLDTGRAQLIRPPIAVFPTKAHQQRAELVGCRLTADRLPQPGAATLAHQGVLRCDDLPELQPAALEALGWLMTKRAVKVTSSQGSCRFPAEFILAATQRPCPCRAVAPPKCRCTPQELHQYRARVPHHLRDRIDLQIQLPHIPAASRAATSSDTTEASAEQVAEARDRARKRWDGTGWSQNAQVSRSALTASPIAGTALLDDALRLGRLTRRGALHALRLAWTLADLDGRDQPDPGHVTEAMALRQPLPQPAPPALT